MSQTFVNPENALKRASELIVVNQKNEAIDVLRTIITSRRYRVWQKSLESVMLKYISLCVELRKGQEAKDGLHQYRGVCQQVNVASLGVVIKFFLEESERYAKEAQSKAEAINLESLEDLDAEETPESMMLGRVSGEDTKDRTDREIVTPWLKFLWETYRTVLDILRNNPKLEGLYQKTAQQAFAFCKKFKRNTEFRRLCELLRGHLSNIGKYAYQPNSINLQAPESMQLHLETRFAQLNVACDLELWQESFRTVEDIHGLLSMSKKPPKSNIMANFYGKLAQIFWVSGNYLFHAYAWNKFYTLSKNHNKALTAEELKTMASSVLLSALSIPIETDRSSDEIDDLDDVVQKEKNIRLAALLGPISTPRRDVLLSELRTRSISASVLPELQDMLQLMEDKFHPLELCESLKPKLEFIAAHPTLKQYLKPLENAILVRLLQQLERVFQTMKLAELYKLAFFIDPTSLEKSLVEMSSKGYVDLHIDHKNGTLNFGSQNLGSDKLRGQLTTLAKGLQTVVEILHPKDEAAEEEQKKKAFVAILDAVVQEHKKALERKKLIEKRKEIKEQMANLLKAKAAAQREEEERRLAQKALEAKAQEDKEQKPKEAPKPKEPEQEPEKKRVEAAVKAKKEMEMKMLTLSKKLDYLERARREEERPLLEEAAKLLEEEARKYYEEQQKAAYDTQHKVHAKQLEEKKRLARMESFRRAFEDRVLKRREEEYNKKKAEQDERLASVRAKLLEERKARAAEQELKKRQREEEKKRIREEAERREEEEAKLEAEREKRRAQEEEERRKEEEELEREEEEKLQRAEEARKQEEERRAAESWKRPGRPEGREPEGRREPPAGRREPEGRREPYGREPEGRREPPGGRREPYGREPEGRREPYGREPEGRREPYGREPEGRREPYGREPEGRREPYGREPEGRREPYGREPEGRREPYGREPEGRREPYGREPEGRREPRREPYGREPEGRREPPGGRREPEGREPEGRREPYGREPEGRREPSGREPEGRREPSGREPEGRREPSGREPEGRREPPGGRREPPGRRDEEDGWKRREDEGWGRRRREDEGRRDEEGWGRRRDEGRPDEGRREEARRPPLGRREEEPPAARGPTSRQENPAGDGDNVWRRGGGSNSVRTAEQPGPKDTQPPRESRPAGRGREPERRPVRGNGAGRQEGGRAASPPREQEPAPQKPAERVPQEQLPAPTGDEVEGDGWSTVPAKRGRGKRGGN